MGLASRPEATRTRPASASGMSPEGYGVGQRRTRAEIIGRMDEVIAVEVRLKGGASRFLSDLGPYSGSS